MIGKIQDILNQGLVTNELDYWKDECSKNPEAFLAFWHFALEEKHEKCWRALWVVEHAIYRNKAQTDLIFPEIYSLLVKTSNHSLLRMGLKLVLLRPIPPSDECGQILAKCEMLIFDKQTPIATRANALQFMYEFCKIEPALAPELELLIEHLQEQNPAGGLKARIRHIRKGLQKLKL